MLFEFCDCFALDVTYISLIGRRKLYSADVIAIGSVTITGQVELGLLLEEFLDFVALPLTEVVPDVTLLRHTSLVYISHAALCLWI